MLSPILFPDKKCIKYVSLLKMLMFSWKLWSGGNEGNKTKMLNKTKKSYLSQWSDDGGRGVRKGVGGGFVDLPWSYFTMIQQPPPQATALTITPLFLCCVTLLIHDRGDWLLRYCFPPNSIFMFVCCLFLACVYVNTDAINILFLWNHWMLYVGVYASNLLSLSYF